MAANKHLPVQQCYRLALPLSKITAAITLQWDLTEEAHSNFCSSSLFFLGLHCDFWYKPCSVSEATCFWPAQPDNLHIHASLAFIHHELPPTQQMFRWGVLSSNLFYVDLLISDARGAQSSSNTCQRLPLTASTSFSHCAKLRKRKRVCEMPVIQGHIWKY